MSIPVQSLSFGSKNYCSPIHSQEISKPATFFSRSDVQYLPITENGDIEMEGFIRACNGIVEFIGFLGSAFSPVKNDIHGNISKVDRVFKTDPQRFGTVKKLLEAEKIDWPNRMGPATEGLMYLKRGLEFICAFLELIVTDSKSGTKSNTLVPMGSEAYKRTLKHHHTKIERGLFKVVIHATPYRKDLLKKICPDRPHAEDECIDDLSRYLDTMKPNVDRLVEFYKEFGLQQ